MSTTQSRSLLLLPLQRSLSGLDLPGLAQQSGLQFRSFERREPTIAAALDARFFADGPALIAGTGSPHRDAEIAAALGIPVALVVADEAPLDAAGSAATLVKEEAEGLGVVIAGVCRGEDLTAQKVAEFAAADAPSVMSPDVFGSWLLERSSAVGAHIVLPEGEEDRILLAAQEIQNKKIARLTILGDEEQVSAKAETLGLDLSDVTVLDHRTSPLREEFAADFAELRKKKGLTLDQAREAMADVSYFGTMMVHKGLADGMVSGAIHTTAHTIRPAFQIIRTAPEASVVSSIFLMVMPGRLWAFGDCAVNPNPTAEQLGEIAVVSARTAAQFGIDPKVAVLSYSTGSSGAGPDVERAVAALARAREIDPQLKIDGPLQFDAAVDAGVGAKKMPGSSVAGQATVFVFPDLEAGNIAYKAVQRTGNALAVGPILQGLNKPINDLSRGATVPDIVNTVAVTAIQAGGTR